ncbi:MAG: hypothetical protein RL653_2334 [Pseudomonadota bacterium]|jgi:ribonuclease J
MLTAIPLGGLGEVGLNALVFGWGDELVLVDAGLMFPREPLPGVDLVLPDFTWLRENAHRLKAVFVTHAHEDHLGALPWLLRDVRVPVYAPPFARALLLHKLEEEDVEADVRELGPTETVQLSDAFSVQPVRMCHSVPDALGFILRTPAGNVVHTGDWKLDPSPLEGWPTDLELLERAGHEGVVALFSDSTNAEVSVHTPSEQVVAGALGRAFHEAPGRLIVSLFASQVGRIRTVMQLCQQSGRKLLVSGRTLQRNLELAQATGHLRIPDGLLVHRDDAGYLPPRHLCILAGGSQAEPRGHLVQMTGDHFPLRIEPGDTVVLSARAVPGNEAAVSQLVDRLFALGAKVLYPRTVPDIHVSGHASAVEQAALIHAVRPRNFIPIHGEQRMLHRHLETARTAGVPEEGLLLATDGDVLAFPDGHVQRRGRVHVGRIFRSRDGGSDIDAAALRERAQLQHGLVVAALALERGTGRIVSGPQLYGRGVTEEEAATLEHAQQAVQADFAGATQGLRGDDAFVREALVASVRRAFKAAGHRRPAVLPAILKL